MECFYTVKKQPLPVVSAEGGKNFARQAIVVKTGLPAKQTLARQAPAGKKKPCPERSFVELHENCFVPETFI